MRAQRDSMVATRKTVRTGQQVAENGCFGTIGGMGTHRKLAVLLSGMTIIVASACSSGGSTNVKPIELGSETGASQTTSSTETVDVGTGVEVGSKETITILIDGWSMAGIAGGSITWEDTTGADMGPLATAPAEESDLEAAAKQDPEALRNLMARIVTGDPTLECGKDGCSTKGQGDLVQRTS